MMAALALAVSLCSCGKTGVETVRGRCELSVSAVADGIPTKGYSETGEFYETSPSQLHGIWKDPVPRTMQLSAYLHPQNGEPGAYFTDKTFSLSDEGGIWWNTNTVGGAHDPIYWPVMSTLDFLAYSVSLEDSRGVVPSWDESNPAEKVVLTVPAENSQNDILFAGVSGLKSGDAAASVNMRFSHAQAWLQFVVTSDSPAPVRLKRIVLRNVYNAGVLTVINNSGRAVASWDFSSVIRNDVTVDNTASVEELGAEPQYLDMLIPQQQKTSVTVCYTVGDDPSERSRTFESDQKTWLMGEKYIYTINISALEVGVTP